MKKFVICLLFVVFSFSSSSSSFAAAPDGNGPWADSVVSFAQGTMKNGNAVPLIRSNPQSAVGVAENDTTDGNFFSLGFSGSMVLKFDNGISGGTIVVEATNPGYPGEKAKVEISADGSNWVVAGTITGDGTVQSPGSISCAKFVRITDVSSTNDFSDETADGFDVDGVKSVGDACVPVTPAPCCDTGCSSVTQNNTTLVTNTIVQNANTGNNTANNTTNGSTAQTTGSAQNAGNVGVIGGENFATISCCPASSTKATIKDNGAQSKNKIVTKQVPKKIKKK